MSLIVSRSSPLFGSVSASNERRWISIRCGTSRGCGRREKLLRVTGAAADLANWATPQMVEGGRIRREGFGQQKGSTARDARRYHSGHATSTASGEPRSPEAGGVPTSARPIPPASSISALSFSASSRSMPSLIGFGASSTSALASLRPRPVAARTALITWIFFSPAPVRTTSTVLDSSSARVVAAAAGGRGRRGDRGRRNAELLLERLDALGELEHRDALELLDPILG